MKKNELKQDNRGFSLVELIIVMAILAILVGAVAPQVFTYVEKSRESKDLQMVDTVFTAVHTVIAAQDEAPADITDKDLDVVTAMTDYADIKKLLADDMETVALIKTKAKSKLGQTGTLYIDYDSSDGKLSVYIGSAPGTATLPVGKVTN